MKFPRQHSLKEIATLIDCEFVGDADFPVMGMNEIHVVENGDIVFVDHPKYYDKALKSQASIVLINKKVDCPEGKALLVSDDPFRDFNKLSLHFKPFEPLEKMLADDLQIGSGTVIQPNVTIGKRVKIGKNCVIYPNVSIGNDCEIGDHVTIHSGTVLGGHAFYYKKRPEGFDKLLSCGKVIIEDHVEIGANCTIDRGVTGDTRIGAGSKMDNLIQIGHDTVIGKKCLIASQVGIAGCVVVGDEVTIWGQVGIRSDVHIAKGSVILAQSGIGKSTEENTTYFGSPAVEAREKMKELAAVKQIPKLIAKLK